MISIYCDVTRVYSPELVVEGPGHIINSELMLSVAAIFKRMGEQRKTAALLFFDAMVNSGILDDCVTRDEILEYLGSRKPVIAREGSGTLDEIEALSDEIPKEVREKYDEMRKGAAHGTTGDRAD